MNPLTQTRARCRDDPDALFVKGADQHQAKLVCRGCPLRRPCLVEALTHRIQEGVWGGMTERQRRALLRAHPTEWDQMITTGPPHDSAQPEADQGPGRRPSSSA